jgi:transcriptional regulator with XRE-family HTH domain
MAHTHNYSRQTLEAARILGNLIAAARRERRWAAADLAERAGISLPTLRKIERGETTVAIGLAFEVATLVGVRLFGVQPDDLPSLLSRTTDTLALLPERVREPRESVNDDF